jgi:uncharacterized protein (TIGR02246 family)
MTAGGAGPAEHHHIPARGHEPREDIMAKKQAFKNSDAAYAKAFNKGDAKGVAALYTRNALHMTPNGPIVKGRKAIETMSAGAHRDGVGNLKFSTIRTGVSGSLAFSIGRLSMDIPTGNGTRREKGKYIDIYEKQKDGSWKVAATIYNSDLPA